MTVKFSNTSPRRHQGTEGDDAKAGVNPEGELVKTGLTEELRAASAFDRQIGAARRSC